MDLLGHRCQLWREAGKCEECDEHPHASALTWRVGNAHGNECAEEAEDRTRGPVEVVRVRQRENQPTVGDGSRDHEYGQESEPAQTPLDNWSDCEQCQDVGK